MDLMAEESDVVAGVLIEEREAFCQGILLGACPPPPSTASPH